MKLKKSLKLLILEFVMIFANVYIYKFLSLSGHYTISRVVSLFLPFLLNYVICLKYIFKQKNSIKYFAFFSSLTILGLGLEKVLSLVCNHYMITVGKVLSNSFIILYNFIFKIVLFDNSEVAWNEKIKNSFLEINELWKNFISLKIVRTVFKILPQNLLLFIFFVGSIYYGILFINDNDAITVYKPTITDSIVGPILPNNDYETTFENIKIVEPVNRIGILFATYLRDNTSKLHIELLNGDKLVYQETISSSKLRNITYYYLDVPSIEPDEISNYKLIVSSPDSTESNCVTIVMNSNDNSPAISFAKTSDLLSIKHIIILCYIILFLVLNYFINKNSKISPSKFYLIMTLYMVSALIIYPPLETPDEPVHLARSINFSQNGLYSSKKSSMNIPENFECLNYSEIERRDMVRDFTDIKECLNSSDNHKVSMLFGVSGKFSRNVLGYIGASTFIKIVDIFTNSPLIIFFAGRLGNFLLAFFLIYKAIKICPLNKKVLITVVTIPMFIQQMLSYSYDSILNAACILIFAYSLAINKGTVKIDWKFKIKILILLGIIASVKVIYLPLAILLLFATKNQFKNNKSRFLYYITLVFGTYLLYILIVNNFFLIKSSGISTGNVVPKNSQLEFLKSNPLQVFPIVFNTIKINGFWYLQSLFGYFTWFKFKFNDFTIISYIIFLIALVLSEDNDYFNLDDKKKIIIKKVVIATSIMIIVAGIFGAMYLGWSSYKLNYIDGVQGRYFLPLLPLLTLLFIPKNSKIKISDNSVYMFINIVMIQYIVYILTFFY